MTVLGEQLPEGLVETLNPGSTEDTPADELIAVPVHPEGTLLGSFRLDRPDGVTTFFLLYDVAGAAVEVESALSLQLDQSPWQTVGGQSTEAISAVNFQSTVSGDVTGTAVVREVDADAEEPTSSVVYIVEVQPSAPVTATPFALPDARPPPSGFPSEFLFDGMTPISVQWTAEPAGSTYQVLMLTRDGSTDVTDRYRTVLEDGGWTLVSDQAQGFATTLDYERDSGASTVSLSIDAFAQDDSYTAVFFSLQLRR